MYISAHVTHSCAGWQLRVAEATHLRSVCFAALDQVCGFTQHRLICRCRWGLRLLGRLAQDRDLIRLPLTRQQAIEIAPDFVARLEEELLWDDCEGE